MDTEDGTHQIRLVLVYYGPNGGDPAAGVGSDAELELRRYLDVGLASPALCSASSIIDKRSPDALVPRYFLHSRCV